MIKRMYRKGIAMYRINIAGLKLDMPDIWTAMTFVQERIGDQDIVFKW
jgi:hypothetical protein